MAGRNGHKPEQTAASALVEGLVERVGSIYLDPTLLAAKAIGDEAVARGLVTAAAGGYSIDVVTPENGAEDGDAVTVHVISTIRVRQRTQADLAELS